MGLVWFQSVGIDDDAGVAAVFWQWFALVLTLCWAGLCMGAVGVGGVFIVPSLIAILHVPAPIAVASVAPAYLAASTSGMWAYRGALQQDKQVCITLMMGALLGGFLASSLVGLIPTSLLNTLLAFFCIMFGLYKLATVACSPRHNDSNTTASTEAENLLDTKASIYNGTDDDDDTTEESSPISTRNTRERITCQEQLSMDEPSDHNGNGHYFPTRVKNFFLGTAVGLGSALSGTAGPLLFIPSFLLCHPHESAAHAVALSQAIGAPMSVAMTFGVLFLPNVSNNDDGNTVDIDAGLSVIVGIVTSLCVPWGKSSMRHLCQVFGEKQGNRAIMACVALLILGSGCYMVVAE